MPSRLARRRIADPRHGSTSVTVAALASVLVHHHHHHHHQLLCITMTALALYLRFNMQTTSLNNEVGDDAMERCAFVGVLRTTRSGAQRSKVLGCSRHQCRVQSDHHSTNCLAIDGNVHVASSSNKLFVTLRNLVLQCRCRWCCRALRLGSVGSCRQRLICFVLNVLVGRVVQQ
jgi:hypothetical protein